MIRRPPRSTQSRSSAASDVYKRQPGTASTSPCPGAAGHPYDQPNPTGVLVVSAVSAELPEHDHAQPDQGGADHGLEDPVQARRQAQAQDADGGAEQRDDHAVPDAVPDREPKAARVLCPPPVTVQGGAVTLVLFGTAGGGEVGDRGYVVPVQAVAAAQHEAGAGDPEDWPGQRGQGGG